jgi:hypothetical protein
MIYTVCVNKPGFLPDMDPYTIEGIEDARGSLIDELERTWDATDDTANAATVEELDRAQGAVANIGEEGGTILLGGYVHCITPAEVNGLALLVRIDLGNDAMQNGTDLANALREIAEKIDGAEATRIDQGNIRDANGNTVGHYQMIGD